jgi:hypothetical protein
MKKFFSFCCKCFKSETKTKPIEPADLELLVSRNNINSEPNEPTMKETKIIHMQNLFFQELQQKLLNKLAEMQHNNEKYLQSSRSENKSMNSECLDASKSKNYQIIVLNSSRIASEDYFKDLSKVMLQITDIWEMIEAEIKKKDDGNELEKVIKNLRADNQIFQLNNANIAKELIAAAESEKKLRIEYLNSKKLFEDQKQAMDNEIERLQSITDAKVSMMKENFEFKCKELEEVNKSLAEVLKVREMDISKLMENKLFPVDEDIKNLKDAIEELKKENLELRFKLKQLLFS